MLDGVAASQSFWAWTVVGVEAARQPDVWTHGMALGSPPQAVLGPFYPQALQACSEKKVWQISSQTQLHAATVAMCRMQHEFACPPNPNQQFQTGNQEARGLPASPSGVQLALEAPRAPRVVVALHTCNWHLVSKAAAP
eukprot:351877-Chlamydomonas_euryale.AAC.5